MREIAELGKRERRPPGVWHQLRSRGPACIFRCKASGGPHTTATQRADDQSAGRPGPQGFTQPHPRSEGPLRSSLRWKRGRWTFPGCAHGLGSHVYGEWGTEPPIPCSSFVHPAPPLPGCPSRSPREQGSAGWCAVGACRLSLSSRPQSTQSARAREKPANTPVSPVTPPPPACVTTHLPETRSFYHMPHTAATPCQGDTLLWQKLGLRKVR